MIFHIVENVGLGFNRSFYICKGCRYETRDLTDVVRHTVANQFTVETPPEIKRAPKSSIHN